MSNLENLKQKIINYRENTYANRGKTNYLSYMDGFNDCLSLFEDCLEALEFYGEKSNWAGYFDSKEMMNEEDWEEQGLTATADNREFDLHIAGKKARQALKNLKEKLKGEK